MRVFIRVDASDEIGTGHVFRCLALAEQLRPYAQVVFICRAFAGHAQARIQQKGFECVLLSAELSESEMPCIEPNLRHSAWLKSSQQADALATILALDDGSPSEQDLLIVDHFSLSAIWETRLIEAFALRVWAIDGQADRAHACEGVIDPTTCNARDKWQGQLAAHTQLYQGLEWVLLQPNFFQQDRRPRQRVKRILVNFGGSDQQNFTQAVLEVWQNLPIALKQGIDITVVVGQNYAFWSQLQASFAEDECVSLRRQIDTMPEVMAQVDLAIGAGGVSAWERLYLGLPSLLVATAHNQQAQVACLAQWQVAESLATDRADFQSQLAEVWPLWISHPERLQQASQRALQRGALLQPDRWAELFGFNKGKSR